MGDSGHATLFKGRKWGITISKLAHMLPTKSVIWALEQFSNVN